MRDSALKLDAADLDAAVDDVGNELMRDSALKPAVASATSMVRKGLEMSSCATAL